MEMLVLGRRRSRRRIVGLNSQGPHRRHITQGQPRSCGVGVSDLIPHRSARRDSNPSLSFVQL